MSANPLAISFGLLFMITTANYSQNLQTVSEVDLNKYAGKWYEVASFPLSFQKGCTGTSAVYTLTDQGYVIVENRCNKGSLTGKVSYIKGKAFAVKNSGNAKLKVQFFWPFKGDYWIIDLAYDYSYAVVSGPGKKSLWILSRTPSLDEATFEGIISRLEKKGFELSKLKMTPHS